MEQGMTKQLFDDNTMTTIEAPKRFWAENWDGTEYVRADNVVSRDEAEAMVAAAYERCAQERDAEARYWSENCNDDERVFHEMHAKNLRALTPADARTALDAMVRKAVEAERVRCARIVSDMADEQHRVALARHEIGEDYSQTDWAKRKLREAAEDILKAMIAKAPK
jgi:hypothetical protein